MKLTSKTEGNVLTVNVSLPLRSGKEPKLMVGTDDVIKELQNRGVEVERVIKGVSILNISESRRHGVAIFELFSEKEIQEPVVISEETTNAWDVPLFQEEWAERPTQEETIPDYLPQLPAKDPLKIKSLKRNKSSRSKKNTSQKE